MRSGLDIIEIFVIVSSVSFSVVVVRVSSICEKSLLKLAKTKRPIHTIILPNGEDVTMDSLYLLDGLLLAGLSDQNLGRTAI